MSGPRADPGAAMARLRETARRLAAGGAGLPPGRLVFGEGNPRARLVLVGLGAVAGKTLVGGAFRLTRDRGQCSAFIIIRQRGRALGEARRLAAADFAGVRARLEASGA